MANPFRDMSVIMQALVAAAVAVVLVLVGVYVPGSPIARERDEVDSAVQKKTKLNQEVTQLQVYKQRYGELKQQMDALSKQLDTLKTIVPEEKETDEFIRLLQGAASASSVQIRRLTSQAIVPKEYHYELAPDGRTYALFGVGVDGKPNTTDDVYPEIPDSLSRRSGYRPSGDPAP